MTDRDLHKWGRQLRRSTGLAGVGGWSEIPPTPNETHVWGLPQFKSSIQGHPAWMSSCSPGSKRDVFRFLFRGATRAFCFWEPTGTIARLVIFEKPSSTPKRTQSRSAVLLDLYPLAFWNRSTLQPTKSSTFSTGTNAGPRSLVF